jgi:hypothetical protein
MTDELHPPQPSTFRKGAGLMQQTMDIPDPWGTDSETVITALETAAAFSAKGDGHEAMRWLRRAAESAGEAGDDRRALALSRRIADLREGLMGKPLPTPSPLLASRPPTAVSGRANLSLVPSPPKGNGTRQAARVAVANVGKPGVLEVRVLADGEAPKPGSAEALLVMLDPSSTVLSRTRPT